MDTLRAQQFHAKAGKLLSWIDKSIEDMRVAGETLDKELVEKEFFVLLSFYESLYQAIVDSAKKLDLNELRENINTVRDSDELLRYIRFARNSEVHDSVLKWSPSMRHLEVKIFDATKVNKVTQGRSEPQFLFNFLYGVTSRDEFIKAIEENPVPSKDRCNDAGVVVLMGLDCLALRSFEVGQGKKKQTIKAPESHLGALIPPSAWVAVNKAKEYYSDMYLRLSEALDHHLTNPSN